MIFGDIKLVYASSVQYWQCKNCRNAKTLA